MTLRDAASILQEAANGWLEAKAPRLSAALAFYTILSLAPLILVAVALAGAVFGRAAAEGALTDQLRTQVGDAGAEVARTTLRQAGEPQAGLLAAVVGLATLLFGASGVFGELQDALNTAWGVAPKPGRGLWRTIRDRILSFAMVVAIGFLLLVSLAANTALTAFGHYVAGMAPGLPTLLHAADFLLSYLIAATLFALIFKVLPDAEIAWRDVWFGALATAALFTAGTFLIGMYLGGAGVATPFGAAGSLVFFIVWIYYSGLILFFGVELTKVSAHRAGRPIKPAPGAEMRRKEKAV